MAESSLWDDPYIFADIHPLNDIGLQESEFSLPISDESFEESSSVRTRTPSKYYLPCDYEQEDDDIPLSSRSKAHQKRKSSFCQPNDGELSSPGPPRLASSTTCSECKRSFGRKAEKDRHDKVQHSCPHHTCKGKMFTIDGLRAHKEVHDGANGAFICGSCVAPFKRSDKLGDHLRAIHSFEWPYYKHQCYETPCYEQGVKGGFYFASEADLYQHQLKKHDISPEPHPSQNLQESLQRPKFVQRVSHFSTASVDPSHYLQGEARRDLTSRRVMTDGSSGRRHSPSEGSASPGVYQERSLNQLHGDKREREECRQAPGRRSGAAGERCQDGSVTQLSDRSSAIKERLDDKGGVKGSSSDYISSYDSQSSNWTRKVNENNISSSTLQPVNKREQTSQHQLESAYPTAHGPRAPLRKFDKPRPKPHYDTGRDEFGLFGSKENHKTSEQSSRHVESKVSGHYPTHDRRPEVQRFAAGDERLIQQHRQPPSQIRYGYANMAAETPSQTSGGNYQQPQFHGLQNTSSTPATPASWTNLRQYSSKAQYFDPNTQSIRDHGRPNPN